MPSLMAAKLKAKKQRANTAEARIRKQEAETLPELFAVSDSSDTDDGQTLLFFGVGQTAHAESLTDACRVGMLCSRGILLVVACWPSRAWKGWKGAVGQYGRKVKSSYISIGHGLSTIPSTSLLNPSLTSSVEEYYS